MAETGKKVLKRKCLGKKKDGSVCKAPPLKGELFCLLHHPERSTLIQAASREQRHIESKAKQANVDFWRGFSPVSMSDVKEMLTKLIKEVRLGIVHTRVASVVSGLSAQLIKTIEVGSLEERLKFLEQRLTKEQPVQPMGMKKPLPFGTQAG
jgi:hypothetical protein